MRKGIWIGVALLVVGLVAGFGIKAVSSDDKGEAAPTPPHIITVSGTASVSSAPDEAIVSLGVQTEGETPEDAYQQATSKVNSVMRALLAEGIGREDISTTRLELNRRYRDRGTPRETITYVAENNMDVTVHDLDTLAGITAKAVGAGANVVGGIEFQLSDTSKAKTDAMKKAVESARAKAEALALAAGTTIGPVVRIDEQNMQVHGYRAAGAVLQSADIAEFAPLKITPQEVQTQVDVTVVWALG